MPTYEYKCNGCDYQFEAFQSISEAPLSTCPKCGNSVERLISGGAGVIFKGTGYYTTDSKKKDSPKSQCPHANSCGCCS